MEPTLRRLHDSHEAWVYAIVEDGGFAGYGELRPGKAVLTWANSA